MFDVAGSESHIKDFQDLVAHTAVLRRGNYYLIDMVRASAHLHHDGGHLDHIWSGANAGWPQGKECGNSIASWSGKPPNLPFLWLMTPV
jgi:hypothetical protein